MTVWCVMESDGYTYSAVIYIASTEQKARDWMNREGLEDGCSNYIEEWEMDSE